MKNLRLGKAPARRDHRDLKLAKYLDLSKFPAIPDQFGHEGLISDWLMLANDSVGDCVISSAEHQTMLWTAIGPKKSAAKFDDVVSISNYAEITGYNPADPFTDQGTDMHDMATFRRKIGIRDSDGRRHRIAANVWLEAGNLQELYVAMYLFSAVDIGIQFPISAEDQFNSGHAWDVVMGDTVEGGHCIAGVCKRGLPGAVTWGRIQFFTHRFYQIYNDETSVPLSREFLTSGLSPEGFNLGQLLADLNALRIGPPVVIEDDAGDTRRRRHHHHHKA
jgi:hypothetical protein